MQHPITASPDFSGVCRAAAQWSQWRIYSAAEWRTETSEKPARRLTKTSRWTPRPASGKSTGAGSLRWATELPPPPSGSCVWAMRQRSFADWGCRCWVRRAAAAGPAQLCLLKSQCVVEWRVLCLGVSAPGGPRRTACCRIQTFLNMSHTLWSSLQPKPSVITEFDSPEWLIYGIFSPLT